MRRRAWLLMLPGLMMLCLCLLWSWFRWTKPQPEMVRVLVARFDVRAGTFLASPEQFFDSETRPQNEVPPGAIADMERLRGKIVVKSIEQGQPVQLVEPGPLVDALPGNARACTVRVEMDPETVEQAQPTAKVDLICWKRLPDGQLEYTMVAENTEVLAVCQADETSSPSATHLRTLALTPEQIERVQNASEGELFLVMHNGGKNSKSPGPPRAEKP